MIVTRTPLRISFAGGGSDLPEFFNKAPGAVLSATIDKYMYLAVNPKFDGGVRVSYSVTENVAHVSDLQHDIARETLQSFGIADGVEVVSIADVPAGTGLGSSSAYAVGLYAALLAHREKIVALPTRHIAERAASIEINDCGRNIGYQDAFASAFGNLRMYEFGPDAQRVGDPLRGDVLSWLNRHLLMFYLGGTHDASETLRAASSEAEWFDRTDQLVRHARDMETALKQADVKTFGELLHETWLIKRAWASNAWIDSVYANARQAGAWGGKVCGAGGGGFLLVCAPPEKHAGIYAALGLAKMGFRFETRGVEVVHV